MLFFSLTAGRVTSISESFSAGCVCRADKDFDAEAIATSATELTGDLYIPVELPNIWPKTDVIKMPKVGDVVSSGFNGDYYPEGKIAKISPSLKIITLESGARFYRRGQTGTWVKQGGTFCLVEGHRNERNPCF